jgi:ribosomal protein S18 acetylase RimI-like enzyme
MKNLIIRPARAMDAPHISELICDLLPFMTLDPAGAGAERFVSSMRTPAIAGYVLDGRYHYLTGWLDGQLAGVVAVRDGSHLFHMFVARALHGRGIARQLWGAVRDDRLDYTVNSSMHAQPLYEKLGFVATGPRIEAEGVAYVPMRLGGQR